MKSLFVLFLLVLLQACTAQTSKINGVSFVASRDSVKQSHINPVKSLGANYTAIMPFGFIRTLDSPQIIHNTERQWFGETEAGAKQYISLLHHNDFQVMMKPQIWIWRGEFTGYMKMENETDWQILEQSYREFILTYARLAAQLNVAILCIGTELEQFVTHRPEYWNNLIAEIKEVYSGKLTYAANWDEYKRVPFWDQMDYIGVDAYFPISESRTPTISEAEMAWDPWIEELAGVAKQWDREVIFTEYGYRSVDFAGKEPWKSDREMTTVNLEAQSNLTSALFNRMYEQPWFAGGFIWKWFIDHENVGGPTNNQFTPQNKPVERLVKERFSN